MQISICFYVECKTYMNYRFSLFIICPRPTTHQNTDPRAVLGDHSCCFTNFLHRFVPRQKFFKYIGIGQKLHAGQNCQQQLKIFENIKSVCLSIFYDTVDISTCSRTFGVSLNSQFLRPMVNGRIAFSAALFEIEQSPSLK